MLLLLLLLLLLLMLLHANKALETRALKQELFLCTKTAKTEDGECPHWTRSIAQRLRSRSWRWLADLVVAVAAAAAAAAAAADDCISRVRLVRDILDISTWLQAIWGWLLLLLLLLLLPLLQLATQFRASETTFELSAVAVGSKNKKNKHNHN